MTFLPEAPPLQKAKHYFGTVLPDGYSLTESDALRLYGLELGNRHRTRKKHADAIVEKVDFIAVCIHQGWRCHICHNPMHPGRNTHVSFRITVEHDPAISVCHEHSKRTVRAAHAICNLRKGRLTDTTRAAKIKRVIKDEDKHKARMEAKVTGDPVVEKPSAFARRAKNGPQIRSDRKIAQPNISPLSKASKGYRKQAWGRK